jgi:hypothetical protein
MVRVEFEGKVAEETVVDGAYLILWWRVPVPQTWPRATAFQVAGRWIDL